MIEVRGLYKAYGLNLAVRGVSFQANKGEIVGLVGRNGAGKSTTMNIIAGYISSDEGNVRINGHDILKEPLEAKRHLGYMPEFPPLYAEMTVFQYLAFVCKLMGVPKGQIEGHLKGILDQVGLEHVKDRLIGKHVQAEKCYNRMEATQKPSANAYSRPFEPSIFYKTEQYLPAQMNSPPIAIEIQVSER